MWKNALKLLQKEYPHKVYGVNVLGIPEIAFDLARKYGAKFVQMDSVCGHLEPNYEKPFLKKLEAMRGDGDIFLLGGVRFKYQPVRSGRSLEEDLKIGSGRCDAIVVTGEGTGITTDPEKIRTFRSILGDFPLIVGAGMTAETAWEQLAISDGAIVGSYFKEGGITDRPVDEARVHDFMTVVAQEYSHGFIYEKVAGEKSAAKCFGDFGGKYNYTWPEGAVIIKYTGNEANVIIPSCIDGLPVVGIGKSAFYQNNKIESVICPEGISRIGEFTFSECRNLRVVHLPLSLEMIDAYAFADSPLETVRLPPRRRKLGQGAFESTKIRKLTLPDSLEVLGDMAFFGRRELETVNIPKDISYFVDMEAPGGWPDDLERYFYGDDSYDYLGAVRTFEGCILLRNVICRNQRLSERQLNQMFGGTPWLMEREKKQ